MILSKLEDLNESRLVKVVLDNVSLTKTHVKHTHRQSRMETPEKKIAVLPRFCPVFPTKDMKSDENREG